MQAATIEKASGTRISQLIHLNRSAFLQMARRDIVWPDLTRTAWTAILQARHGANAAHCRLFHQHRLQGPFSDEEGAYFLCDVGHRIPLPILPASRPSRKARVWTGESSPSAGPAAKHDTPPPADEMRRFVQTLIT